MKKILCFLVPVMILLVSCVDRNYYGNGYAQPVYIAPGVGLGTVIAVVISWSRNKSILWAIIHGLLGWLYVIYALLVRKK
ncbi:MAG TPA: hypothetical protein VL307_14630 [Chitinophagaceae bacterium]|nr:hypothetical protein [Chitinophagaceae bacterium]